MSSATPHFYQRRAGSRPPQPVGIDLPPDWKQVFFPTFEKIKAMTPEERARPLWEEDERRYKQESDRLAGFLAQLRGGRPYKSPGEVESEPPPRRPVPHDGWTVERQRCFIDTLAQTGIVTEAAKAAGMSARSAYRLRARAGSEAFADAWHHAVTLAGERLVQVAFARAIEGAESITKVDGEEVRRTRTPSDRMLCFLLTHLQADRFGALAHSQDLSRPLARYAADSLPRLSRQLEDTDDDPLTDAPTGE